MITNYKPLTREQFNTLYQRMFNNPAEENTNHDLMQAVEQAVIENYLAQNGQSSVPDGWKFKASYDEERTWLQITTPHKIGAALSARRYIGNGDETIASQVISYLSDVCAAAPTPPAPQDAQVGKDAERYRALAWAMETNDKDARLVLNKYLEPTPSRETVGKIADELIAIAAANGKE